MGLRSNFRDKVCFYQKMGRLPIGIFCLAIQLTVPSYAKQSPASATTASAATTSANTSTTANTNITTQTTDSNAQSASQKPAQTFKLSATKVNLGLEQLNDVGLDLKNVLSATRHLYDEVMIQPVSIITEPEMVAGCVINLPVGTEPTGPPMPPRKARVDMIMSQIRPVIALLKQNADQFMIDSQISNFPEDIQPKLDPLFKKWLTHMDDAYGRLLDLEKLTVGPPYDNYAIAETTKIIQQDIKQIDEARRPIYKIMQEESKKLSQNQ